LRSRHTRQTPDADDGRRRGARVGLPVSVEVWFICMGAWARPRGGGERLYHSCSPATAYSGTRFTPRRHSSETTQTLV